MDLSGETVVHVKGQCLMVVRAALLVYQRVVLDKPFTKCMLFACSRNLLCNMSLQLWVNKRVWG
jgi:hypothetical protein